jgi:hypothetical protein
MPVSMIERQFADTLQLTAEVRSGSTGSEDEGVRWLFSFPSIGRHETYCLREAPAAEAIRRGAPRADLPADVIVETTGVLQPSAALWAFVATCAAGRSSGPRGSSCGTSPARPVALRAGRSRRAGRAR